MIRFRALAAEFIRPVFAIIFTVTSPFWWDTENGAVTLELVNTAAVSFVRVVFTVILTVTNIVCIDAVASVASELEITTCAV